MAGQALKKSPPKKQFSLISDEKFRQMFAAMVRLHNHRKARGLEAVLVGTTIDLRSGDMIFAPAELVPPRSLKDEAEVLSASSRKNPYLAMSAGAALGLRAYGNSVVVVFCTAESLHRKAWRQSLLLAGAYKLPILFVLLPQRGRPDKERVVAAISSEATGAGVISIPVDTSDAVAMYRVAFESIERARRRSGATLIVCTRYALEEEKEKKRVQDDPVTRMQAYLEKKGLQKPARKKLS